MSPPCTKVVRFVILQPRLHTGYTAPNQYMFVQANGLPEARTQIKIVENAEKVISAQINKLQKKRDGYVADFIDVDGC